MTGIMLNIVLNQIIFIIIAKVMPWFYHCQLASFISIFWTSNKNFSGFWSLPCFFLGPQQNTRPQAPNGHETGQAT